MSDYLTARRARYERNQAALIQLIKDVQEKDPSVEAYVHHETFGTSIPIDSVVFFRGEEINTIDFLEVPYRWSGCGHREFSNSHYGGDNVAMPFTADDVINNFHSVTGVLKSQHIFKSGGRDMFKSKEHYLEWCSYLKRYETTSNPT